MQYYQTDTQIPDYIPYPKFLLKYPMSETARLLYSLILCRMHLSQQNRWVDEENRVYCRYPVQNLIEDSAKGKTAVSCALHDLEANGLLYRCRDRFGRSNRLYLKVPDIRTTDVRVSEPHKSGNPNPNKYTKNKTIKILNYDYTGDSL